MMHESRALLSITVTTVYCCFCICTVQVRGHGGFRGTGPAFPGVVYQTASLLSEKGGIGRQYQSIQIGNQTK